MKITTILRISKLLIIVTLSSCGIPKETLELLQNKRPMMKDFPIDYCNSFPSLNVEQWDKDYNSYNKYLTSEMKISQVGLSFKLDSVEIWQRYPSIRPYVQLDTLTMIEDPVKLKGNWRVICNRRITYIDSAVYSNLQIHRSSKVLYDEKNADVFLVLSDSKFTLYGTESNKINYKRKTSQYKLINKRFVRLGGDLNGVYSFVGIDKEGHLILNTFYVEERKKKSEYIVYEATMTQQIYERQ